MPLSETKSWMPFNLYDFFGYLFPGIVFCLLLLSFYTPYSLLNSRYYLFIRDIHMHFGFPVMIAEIVLGIVIVYLIGNFIATISHVVIDRIVIGSLFKYPYFVLLNIDVKEREIAWPIHKAIFVLVNIALIVAAISYFKPICIKALVVVVYILLFFIVMRFFLTIIKAFNPKFESYEIKKNLRYWIVSGWYGFLIDKFILVPLQKLLFIDKKFEKEYAKKLKEKICTRFNLKEDCRDSEMFWLPNLCVLKIEPFSRMVNNWLHLYSLNRNVSFASFMTSICFTLHILFFQSQYSFRRMIVLIIAILCSWFFGMRYLMLYYTYYSKNVFRMFYISDIENDTK